MSLVQKNAVDEIADTSVDISLHAVEITYRHSIHKIVESLQSICTKTARDRAASSLDGHSNRQLTKDKYSHDGDARERRLVTTITKCGSMCTSFADDNGIHASMFSADDNIGLATLFGRCGYIVSHLSGCETASLGLIFSDVSFDVSSDVAVVESNTDDRAKDSMV